MMDLQITGEWSACTVEPNLGQFKGFISEAFFSGIGSVNLYIFQLQFSTWLGDRALFDVELAVNEWISISFLRTAHF